MEESTSGATHPEGDPGGPDVTDPGAPTGPAYLFGEEHDLYALDDVAVPDDPAWELGHDLPGGRSSLVDVIPMPARSAPESPHRRIVWWPALVAGVAGALATVAALWALGLLDTGEVEVEATPVTAPAVVEIREIVSEGDGSSTASAVALKVTPSIVAIEVGEGAGGRFTAFASGSGVVMSNDGLIVTNHHVVADAESTQVVFQDGSTYEARLIGSDESTDVAVLEVDATDLNPIDFGETSGLSIGDPAIAIGNPLGLAGGASLTVGVISAFEREVDTGSATSLLGMLQTDAPITQGSSGGALVDAEGRLIGITTAIGVSSAGAEGIGFAIPVEVVRRIADEIVETGTVHHAFLGVELDNHFEQRTDGATIPGGALVIRFPNPDSAAETAGLLVGDIITGIDGRSLVSREALISSLRRLHVGDTVTLDVLRDDEVLTIEVELGERPPDEEQ